MNIIRRIVEEEGITEIETFLEISEGLIEEYELSDELKQRCMYRIGQMVDDKDFKNTGKSLQELLSEYENEKISLDEIFKISDKEVQPMYDASKDRLTVNQEQTQLQEAIVQDNSAPIENTHMDPIYIEKNDTLEIDEEYFQVFQTAQDKGEDLEEAGKKYTKEKEREKEESKRTQETTQREDEKILETKDTHKQEFVVAEQNETSSQTIDSDLRVEELSMKDTNSLKKSEKKGNKKKEKEGNSQFLDPIEFSRTQLITTPEINEAISGLKEPQHEKENGDEEISQD